MSDRTNTESKQVDKTTKGRNRSSRTPRAHQLSRVESSPSGVTLRSDGSNFLEWFEALSNYLTTEYTPHGQLLKLDQYVVDPGPVRTDEQWNELRDEIGLTAAQLSKLKEKYAENRIEKRDKMLQDRYAMYGTARQYLLHSVLERLHSIDGYAEIHAAGNQPLEFVRLVRRSVFGAAGNLRQADMLDHLFNNWYSWHQGDRMTDTQYYRQCEEKYQALVSANHPSRPTLTEACRLKTKLLDSRRHSEYKAHCQNGNLYPQNWTQCITQLEQFIPSNPVQRSRTMLMYSFQSFTRCDVCGRTNHSTEQCRLRGGEPCQNCGRDNHTTEKCTKRRRDGVTASGAAVSTHGSDQDTSQTATTRTRGGRGKSKAAEDRQRTDSGHDRQVKKAIKHAKGVIANQAAVFSEASEDEGYETSEQELRGYALTIKLHGVVARAERDPRMVYIDSLADHAFTNNKDLATNWHSHRFKIESVTGKDHGNLMGTMPCFGDVAYTPQSGVSAIPMDTIENYPYKIESKIRWLVEISPSLTLTFAYDKDHKAYGCVFTDPILKKLKNAQASGFAYYQDYFAQHDTLVKVNSISTVTTNEARYSRQEIARARRARELMAILYHPSDETMIRTLVNGTMLNCNVTPQDVRLAAKIYGRSAPFAMGRWKDSGPIRTSEVLVPKQTTKEQTIYADILAWREVPFLLFIIKPLNMLMVQWLPKGSNMDGMLVAFEAMIGSLQSRGFAPSMAHVDPESILTGLTDRTSIPINTVGTGAHVADAEVEIKLVKEILRSSEAGLPFPVALRFVRSHMLGAIMYRNTMLRRESTVSPREEFTGVKFDVKLHANCKHAKKISRRRRAKEPAQTSSSLDVNQSYGAG
jgi:hypothetical protein